MMLVKATVPRLIYACVYRKLDSAVTVMKAAEDRL